MSEEEGIRFLHPDEIRIDTFSYGVPGFNHKVCMTLTHLPTGNFVRGEGSGGYRLRKLLEEELREKVFGPA